jgi:hypothetical protein
MKYINPEMLTQDKPCGVRFTLHAEKVNTIRYKSEPYDTVRGRIRQFDLYVPREVFLDEPIPEELILQIAIRP